VASDFPACLKVVEERVKPYRHQKSEEGEFALGKALAEKWWVYNRPRRDLFDRIQGMQRVLVRPEVSNTHAMVFLPPTILFSNVVCVFLFDDCDHFLTLQSSIHECWARRYASSMRTDLRYTTADCFETFPFPEGEIANSQRIVDSYCQRRQHLAVNRNIGLTKIHNAIHDVTDDDADVSALRRFLIEMDNAVVTAYGWSDLNLGHGFHESKQGVRFTISKPARREVLSRLLKLNHERYAEEVKKGLHEKKCKASPAAKRKPKETERIPATLPTLFDIEGVDVAFPNTDRERLLCGLLCDLVAAEPGLRFDDYLDGLVIALRPQKYNRLLIGDERTKFTKLAEKLNTAGGRESSSIPWDNLVEVLSQGEAIRKAAGDTFDKGGQFETVRSDFPNCDPKLVALVHKAATTLREYQDLGKSAPAQANEIVSQSVEDRKALAGATE
jgi:hypothetical protein